MNSLQLFTQGTGGLGSFAGLVEAITLAFVLILVAWVVIVALREMAEEDSTRPLITAVLRSAVLLGLAGVLFFAMG